MKKGLLIVLVLVALPGPLVLLGALAALLGGRATARYALGLQLVAKIPSRRKVREALRAAASRHGLEPDWLDTIGWVESRWRLSATNLRGTDGARGGSWGPTMVSARTARAWGYDGDMARFTTDLDFAADFSAQLLEAGFGDPGGRGQFQRYGKPASLEQAVAVWNAGVPELRQAPERTRDEYWPEASAARSKIQDLVVA